MMMRYCIKLILSRWSSFKFVRSLLENQVENIRQTGGPDRAAVHQALIEQLGTYSKDLRNLERANPIADAQQASEDIRIKKEQKRKGVEARIAECARYIDTFKISYQGLIDISANLRSLPKL